MKDALIVSALSVVPKSAVARWMGGFARTRFPAAVQRALLRGYVWKYRVDLSECEGDVGDYPTLVDFFTRPLRPGVRPVDMAPEAIVSPVDGAIYAVGTVERGRLIQAPGIDYAASDLLGGGHAYEGGAYAVIYLSPKDYHRVHTPREGAVRRYAYLPGRLWPVFPAATRRIRDLFAQNERLVSFLDTDLGEVALVMVGAFGVGRMRVVYADVVSNQGEPAAGGYVSPPRRLGRAEELGRFEMGSTVILVFPPGTVQWTVKAGEAVRLGQRIAIAQTDRSAGSGG